MTFFYRYDLLRTLCLPFEETAMLCCDKSRLYLCELLIISCDMHKADVFAIISWGNTWRRNRAIQEKWIWFKKNEQICLQLTLYMNVSCNICVTMCIHYISNLYLQSETIVKMIYIDLFSRLSSVRLSDAIFGAISICYAWVYCCYCQGT